MTDKSAESPCTTADSLDEGAAGRRRFVAGAAAWMTVLEGCARSSFSESAQPNTSLNGPRNWPVDSTWPEIPLTVHADDFGHRIERRIFGTNLEWFNDAGGLANARLAPALIELAKDLGVSVFRFPGGTLSDFYHWKDGIGPNDGRPMRKHPTDSGSSRNEFGTPELFQLMRRTGAEALITVNAGTGSSREAADWVRYCNRPNDVRRDADGFPIPMGIKLWEVGNELYYPGNPGEVKIGTTPESYADRFVSYSDDMRGIDPSIQVIGIGIARGAHIGPDTAYPEWSEVLLKRAASRVDMIAVHNSYFPMLYNVVTPPIETVYPALWGAPDAVESSLSDLGRLISRYEGNRQNPIGISVTEWGALFSTPQLDPYWVDHVKTLGSAIYLARTLQVLLAQPRVKLANHFKFTDRSYVGMVNYDGKPKVPFFALQLYAKHTGSDMVAAQFGDVPTFDAEQIGEIAARRNIPELTALASRDRATGRLYVNVVNRSIRRSHRLRLQLRGMSPKSVGELLMLTGAEPTSNNGRDIPPEWPYSSAYEPYSSPHTEDSPIQRRPWRTDAPMVLPPFSVVTFVVDEVDYVP